MGYHIEYTHTNRTYMYHLSILNIISRLHKRGQSLISKPTSMTSCVAFCLHVQTTTLFLEPKWGQIDNMKDFCFFFSEGFVQIPTVLQIRICGLYPKFSEKKGLSWRLDWLFSSFEVRFAFSCFHFMALSTGATLPLYDDACRGGHGKGQQGRTVGEFLELWEWRWGQSCMDGFGASIHCTVHDSKRSWLLSTRHETSSLSGHKTQLLLCCLYFCFILALLGMKSLVFHTN